MVKTTDLTKSLSDSFTFGKANYSRELFDFIMGAEVIDVHSEAFADILYQIKTKSVNSLIYKAITGGNQDIYLCIGNKEMPRAFKVFRAGDVKNGRKDDKKIYIDCTRLIRLEGGVYRCDKLQILTSYIVSAITNIIYYKRPQSIIMSAELNQIGASAFVDMAMFVLGHLRIPVNYGNTREKMMFHLAAYYLRSVVMYKTDNAYNIAKKISKLDDRTADGCIMVIEQQYIDRNYLTIAEFIEYFGNVFLPNQKDTSKLTIDSFISKWMYLFGPNTYLGTELFPYFATILTDCYIGAYINQQNTIEKIVGRDLVNFTQKIFSIGSE